MSASSPVPSAGAAGSSALLRTPRPRRRAWRSAKAALQGETRSGFQTDNRGSARRVRRPSRPWRPRRGQDSTQAFSSRATSASTARPGQASAAEIGAGELWEVPAIGDHHRRARPVGAHERARHGAKEVVAHDPARHRITRLEGANQSDGDIVAVDRDRCPSGAPMRPRVIAGVAAEGSSSAAAKVRIVVSNGIDALSAFRGLDNGAFRPARFVEKRRPDRHVVVPLDERWRRAEPADRRGVERPDGLPRIGELSASINSGRPASSVSSA